MRQYPKAHLLYSLDTHIFSQKSVNKKCLSLFCFLSSKRLLVVSRTAEKAVEELIKVNKCLSTFLSIYSQLTFEVARRLVECAHL